MKKLLIYFFIAFISIPAWGRQITSYSVRGKEVRAVKGELIVKFRDGLSRDIKETVLSAYGAKITGELRGIGAVKIEVPAAELEYIMDSLGVSPYVEYAEPNIIYSAQKLPSIYNDLQELETSQWGLVKVQAPSAWEIATGSGRAVIAVIDSGVEISHPDLSANIWVNAGEVSNGVDTDGNGYADDINGWNFVDNNNNPNPADPKEWHGTHVAGIAAASGTSGAVGMSWGNKIMPLRALWYDPSVGEVVGDFTDIYSAIEYAADNGAHVINMSLGGTVHSPAMEATVNYAYNSGSVVIAASGNIHPVSGLIVAYPAAYENVIAVGATDQDDSRASFSCYIPPTYGHGVDIVAPGVDIRSTDMGGIYSSRQGTSMAAPFVAGLASLIISYYEDRGVPWNFEEIKRILVQNADAAGGGGYPVHDPEVGYGRINAYATMNFVDAGGFPGEPLSPIAFPNPFNPYSQQVLMRLSERNTGTLKEYTVFTLSGRVVRRESGLSGRSATWDGKNDKGELCASGLYFFALSTYEGSTERGKLTLLR